MKKTILWTIILSLFFINFAHSQKYKDIKTLYKAKDYNQAIPLALSFISQHQNHFQAHYDLYCAYDFLFKSENTNNLKNMQKTIIKISTQMIIK